MALEAQFDGPAVSPSLVQHRINSLAAYDKGLLNDVARAWRSPEEVTLDLMDPAADFWASAWSEAMRFLDHPCAAATPRFATVRRQIQHERDVLFGAAPTPIESFEVLLATVRNPALTYDDYRRLDRGVFRLERPVSVQQVAEMVEGDAEDEDAGFERLRVFLAREELLGREARRWLETRLRNRWLKLKALPEQTGGLLVLMNVVLGAVGRDEPPRDIAEHFIWLLHENREPARLAPFGYLLLRQDWVVP